MGAWTGGRADGELGESETDGRTDGRTESCVSEGRTDMWVDGQADGWTKNWVSRRRMDGRTDGRTEKWTDERADGRAGEQASGRIGRLTDRPTNTRSADWTDADEDNSIPLVPVDNNNIIII